MKRGTRTMTKVDYKELDRLQKETGDELFKLLEAEYKTRIVIGYMNLHIETIDRAFEVNIYNNDYDYKIISLKFDADISAAGYLNVIKHILFFKNYEVHNATAEEIYLYNLIKEYGLDFYIIDGTLMAEGEEIADLNEVIAISKDENRIVIEEEYCRCVIDLETNTYYCEDIEDDEDIDLGHFGIKQDISKQDVEKFIEGLRESFLFLKTNFKM